MLRTNFGYSNPEKNYVGRVGRKNPTYSEGGTEVFAQDDIW